MNERQRSSGADTRSGARRSVTADAPDQRNTSTSAASVGADPGSPESSGQTLQSSGNGGIIDKVRDKATAQLNTQKDRATDGIGSVVDAVRNATRQLRDQNHSTLADYVERSANQLERWSKDLRNKDVAELLRGAQNLARRQPAMFVGSAFALGLLSARFLKSSSPDDDRSRQPWQRYDPDEYASGTNIGRTASVAPGMQTANPSTLSTTSDARTDRERYSDTERY
jgi:hypothetical protein